MQQVPAFDLLRLTADLGEAGCRPDVAAHVVLAGEDLRCCDDFGEDRATAHQLNVAIGLGLAFDRQSIQALENALFGAFGQFGVRVVLVEQGDVVVDVLLIDVHPAHAVVHDDRQFVGIRRVVGNAARHGG